MCICMLVPGSQPHAAERGFDLHDQDLAWLKRSKQRLGVCNRRANSFFHLRFQSAFIPARARRAWICTTPVQTERGGGKKQKTPKQKKKKLFQARSRLESEMLLKSWTSCWQRGRGRTQENKHPRTHYLSHTSTCPISIHINLHGINPAALRQDSSAKPVSFFSAQEKLSFCLIVVAWAKQGLQVTPRSVQSPEEVITDGDRVVVATVVITLTVTSDIYSTFSHFTDSSVQ